MSQNVTMEVAIDGMAQLLEAVREAGAEYRRQREFRDVTGTTHDVTLVVKDANGAEVGVKVDEASGRATFVGHDRGDGQATSLAQRVTQRYAYARVVDELKRKGYQLTKEERQADGTIALVAQRWR